MDVHEPYAPLDYNNMKELLYLITKYRYFPDKITNKENQKLINLYDLEIKYTDNAIKNFLIALKKLKKFDDCIIIVTADHGDAFKEHGILGHGFGSEAKVYDEIIHVPLIIYGLDEKNIKINKQVQLLDLSPTICELVNIPKPINFFGENILSQIKEKMVIKSERYIAYRTPNHKLIIPKMDDEENELYDLKKDSEEKRNIYNINKKLGAKLELEMISLLKKYKKKREVLEIKNKLIKKASS
jgi:arylsulfatase A-like enzyme